MQQYVQSQIWGLQVKASAQLCSKVPVSLAGAPPPNVRRWVGPWSTTQSGYVELQNLLPTADYLGDHHSLQRRLLVRRHCAVFFCAQ